MRDVPACSSRWSGTPLSDHRLFLRHDHAPEAHVRPCGDRHRRSVRPAASVSPGSPRGRRGGFARRQQTKTCRTTAPRAQPRPNRPGRNRAAGLAKLTPVVTLVRILLTRSSTSLRGTPTRLATCMSSWRVPPRRFITSREDFGCLCATFAHVAAAFTIRRLPLPLTISAARGPTWVFACRTTAIRAHRSAA